MLHCTADMSPLPAKELPEVTTSSRLFPAEIEQQLQPHGRGKAPFPVETGTNPCRGLSFPTLVFVALLYLQCTAGANWRETEFIFPVAGGEDETHPPARPLGPNSTRDVRSTKSGRRTKEFCTISSIPTRASLPTARVLTALFPPFSAVLS